MADPVQAGLGDAAGLRMQARGAAADPQEIGRRIWLSGGAARSWPAIVPPNAIRDAGVREIDPQWPAPVALTATVEYDLAEA